ncbi:MAG TPA: hypothetical protein VK527_10650 [Candidatus Limnocylindrales bacterium]|nr:hypothetical protein [Candidatus Limnocylindrales bacterium]
MRPGGSFTPHTSPPAWYSFQPEPEVTAHHAFDVVPLRAPDQHGSAFEERCVLREGGREGGDLRGHVVVRHDAVQLLEPEAGHLGEHATLARNAFAEDDVVRGDPIGRHDEERVSQLVDVAHFSGVVGLPARDLDLAQRALDCFHVHYLRSAGTAPR